VLIFGGSLNKAAPASTEFIPLLRTSNASGLTNWMQMQDPTLPHDPTTESYVMAARLSGSAQHTPAPGGGAEAVQAIAVADTDIISDIFFAIRRQGDREYRFDNVAFVLNCVDQLAGDMSLIKLRNRRPEYRTLTMIEEITQKAEQARLRLEEKARTEAEERLTEAQERLDKRLNQILEQQRDLYGTATQIQLLQQAEEKKLEATRQQIERRKEQAIAEAEQEMQQSIRSIENSVRFWALVLPPLPAIIIGLLVLAWQIHRERAGTPLTRSMRQV
jgi:ABC-2 type transport system permease protein